MEMGKYRIYPDDTEYTGAQHDDDHRADALSQPAGGCNGAIHKGGNAVCKCHDLNPLHARIDHRTVSRKCPQEISAAKEQTCTKEKSDQEGVSQCYQIAFLHPFPVACAAVLAHKAGAARVKGRHDIEDDRICIRCCCIARNHDRVEIVDTALYK